MSSAVHLWRLLRRERRRALSADGLALDLGVPSGRVIDMLNERRSIMADTAFRLGRYFANPRMRNNSNLLEPDRSGH